MGSRRVSPERMSNDLDEANHHLSTNNSSPSYFSSSDFSSNDSNDDFDDSGSQPGPSAIGVGIREPLSSSAASAGPPSKPLTMVKPFACNRCPKSYEKRHELKYVISLQTMMSFQFQMLHPSLERRIWLMLGHSLPVVISNGMISP